MKVLRFVKAGTLKWGLEFYIAIKYTKIVKKS